MRTMIKKTTTPKTKMKVGGVAGAKAGAKKKMKAGSTTRTCPSGFTLVGGKCVDMSGKEASYPYIAPSGAMYTTRETMVAGKPTNPLSAEGRKAMEGVDRKTLTREQMQALGIRKAGGTTTAVKKKMGGATPKKKMVLGGATDLFKKKKKKSNQGMKNVYGNDFKRKQCSSGWCRGN